MTNKPAGDYLSSGPQFGEGDVIERIESFRGVAPASSTTM